VAHLFISYSLKHRELTRELVDVIEHNTAWAPAGGTMPWRAVPPILTYQGGSRKGAYRYV
jgi:hypothetical protein